MTPTHYRRNYSFSPSPHEFDTHKSSRPRPPPSPITPVPPPPFGATILIGKPTPPSQLTQHSTSSGPRRTLQRSKSTCKFPIREAQPLAVSLAPNHVVHSDYLFSLVSGSSESIIKT